MLKSARVVKQFGEKGAVQHIVFGNSPKNNFIAAKYIGRVFVSKGFLEGSVRTCALTCKYAYAPKHSCGVADEEAVRLATPDEVQEELFMQKIIPLEELHPKWS
jgi:hypothetical protein